MSEKVRKYLRFGVEMAIMVVAYGYLGYRLGIFDYSGLSSFSFTGRSALCLVVALALMPLNIGLEAWRWQTLVWDIHPIVFRDSVAQVCYGLLAGFITPYQLGDIPGRVLHMGAEESRAQLIGVGYIGSVMTTVVCIVAGLPAAGHLLLNDRWSIAMAGLAVIAAVAGLCFSKTRVPLLQTLLRYAVWMIQFYLMLLACGISLSPLTAVAAISAYYALVTLTPNIPAADPAIRGSWAVIVFGVYSPDTAAIMLAAVGIWAVNTIFPMLLNIFSKKNLQK